MENAKRTPVKVLDLIKHLPSEGVLGRKTREQGRAGTAPRPLGRRLSPPLFPSFFVSGSLIPSILYVIFSRS